MAKFEKSTFVIGKDSNKDELLTLPDEASKIRLENDNTKLFYRVCAKFTNPDTTLVLSDPNAKMIIIKDGVASDVLPSGSYKVFDYDDFNLKRKFFFKKTAVLKDDFLIDVIVYNPTLNYEGKWGTDEGNGIPYRDPETNIPVDIKGRGKYDIKIADVAKFHSSLVGADRNYSIDNLLNRINLHVISFLRSELAKTVHELNLGYIDLPVHEKEISDKIQPLISEMLNEQYGLFVPVFSIEQFFIDESKRQEIEGILRDNRDESKYRKDAEEIAAEIERLDDKKWERSKYLIGLRREDESKYLEVIKILGLAEINSGKSKKDNDVDEKKASKYCPKCGEAVSVSDTFCPNCGSQINKEERKCPHCGKVSTVKGKFCPHCGKTFN